ncbi:HNH endonuclease [Mycobacterium avium subsp. hominissuis]|nr:HNH endonuclease [Mycobacterium avium subsp. hominissuis]MBZ4524132.1 HNH endonuclease [Mycobacterium avium subsp. hominissuis]MBZ4543902.1 HNH endonuclease [Mycobacterium avium subsp. hominissuis]MBZ4553018.1 HNH endonuclease [Mycobacterium avium subsp. hominissuis]MBZ4562531.1 HNH endonuclease [Mycobacterium avium subsp. hominissuis]
MTHTRWEWFEIRNRVLARDNYECQSKRYGCLGKAEEVNHIVPQIFGGTDDDDNLQSLCPPCHERETSELKIEIAKRRKAEAEEARRKNHPGRKDRHE